MTAWTTWDVILLRHDGTKSSLARISEARSDEQGQWHKEKDIKNSRMAELAAELEREIESRLGIEDRRVSPRELR